MKKNIGDKLICRFCNAQLKHTFADLGMSPIANVYIKPEEKNKAEMFYPLHVYVCSKCFLVQLPSTISREIHFNDEYAYFSSYSKSWLLHAKNYVSMMIKRFGYNKKSLVVEVASNDGYLLQYFKQSSIPALGIEPCANVAKVARKMGIKTLVEFFGVDMARKLKKQGVKADLIIGNNVLAHVPDINDFVKGIKILLAPKGIVTIEFPHLKNLIDKIEFDTIYHEHYSYLSLITVEKIFAFHGMTIFDVEEIPTHGGSLRIFARHTKNMDLPITQNVVALRKKEINAGFKKVSTYEDFQSKVIETKRQFIEYLAKQKKNGKRIVAYGAPAKGNTFLNYCGVGKDFIEYTVDASPHKQNRLLPGTHIPVYAPSMIKKTKPDIVIVLPWNLKKEIEEQMNFIHSWGGKFF